MGSDENVVLTITRHLLISGALLLGCSDDPTTIAEPIQLVVDATPRWSPDGSRLLYYHYGVTGVSNGAISRDPDSIGVWIANSDGSERKLLLRGSSIYADWISSADSLVYEVRGQIYRAAVIGSKIDTLSIQQLTSAGNNFFPACSADSRWICYDSDVGTGGGAFEIWVMRADGTEKRRIDRTGAGEWRMPSWSPTNSISHIRYPTGTYYSEVYMMNIDGGAELRVTNNQSEEGMPRFSPDGSAIAFHSTLLSTGETAVWIKYLQGSATKLIDGRDPAWSPDGTRIVFIRLGDNAGEHGTVWEMNIDGSGLRQVTFGPE